MSTVTVHGGAGGTAARLEDLRATAQALSGIADELTGLFADCLRSSFDPYEAAYAVIAPLTWAQVGGARTGFTVSTAGLATALHGTALALRSAADSYEQAEAVAERLIDDALSTVGNVAGHALRFSLPFIAGAGAVAVGAGTVVYAEAKAFDAVNNAVSRAFGGQGMSDRAGDLERAARATTERARGALERAAFAHPEVTRGLIEHVLPGLVNGFMGVPPGVQIAFGELGPWPHDSMSLTTVLTAAAGRFGLLLPTAVSVERRPLGDPSGVSPATASDVFSRELATHRGRDNGRVRVDRVRGADGVERAVVYVPATTDWSPRPGKNGTDLTTNVQTVAGDDSVMREAVRQALDDAGFGHGSEVMLVGYSQGGIVAGSLAADPAFRKKYQVKALATAGSPISDFRIPQGTRVLSIEHRDDLVPNLDGNRNPDRSNWTTLTIDRDAVPGESPGAAHAGENYRKSIAGLEETGNRELSEFGDHTRGFRGDVIDSREYEAVRR